MQIEFNKFQRLGSKRCKRWHGANYSERGTCNRCGKRRQVGHIHYLGNDLIKDHQCLCSECWKFIPKNWHPCGCGG